MIKCQAIFPTRVQRHICLSLDVHSPHVHLYKRELEVMETNNQEQTPNSITHPI